MLVIPSPLLTESKQDQVPISWYTCFGSSRIYLPIVVYCSAHTDHETCLEFFFKILSNSSEMFLVSIRAVFHCQVAVKLFFLWQWYLFESMSAIHVLVSINNSFSLRQNLYPSQNLYVFLNRFSKFSSNSYIFTFRSTYLYSRNSFDSHVLKTRLTIFAFVFVKSFSKIISVT